MISVRSRANPHLFIQIRCWLRIDVPRFEPFVFLVCLPVCDLLLWTDVPRSSIAFATGLLFTFLVQGTVNPCAACTVLTCSTLWCVSCAVGGYSVLTLLSYLGLLQ